jgi:hypothetical protein
MSKVIRLTEEDLIKLVKRVMQEQSKPEYGLGAIIDEPKKVSQVKDKKNKVDSKRPHDKMVIDCLIKDGFKSVNDGGKYDVYLEKPKLGVMKLQVSSQQDPTKFNMTLMNNKEGKSVGFGQIVIGTTTSCEDLVKFANKPQRMMGAL